MARRSLSQLLLVVLSSALYTCTIFWAQAAPTPATPPPAGVPNQPLRIGIMLPLDGSLPDIANSALVGAKVAVDEINGVGGYLGRRVELLIKDDTGEPAIGYKVAQELANQPDIIGTVGICNTAVAIKVAEYFQAVKHPLIVTCATGSNIAANVPPALSYTFRTAANSTIQAEFLADELQKTKYRKIALLIDNLPYGDAGLKDLQTALVRHGIKPKVVLRFNSNSKNVDKEMQELKASGADALVSWGIGPEQGMVALSKANVGWQVPLYGAWDLSNATAYAGSNGKVEGALMVQTVLPNRRLERNATFLNAYGKYSKERPMGSMMSAAQTYDAVHLLMRALYAAKGDTRGDAIKKALENSTSVYRGVVTTYDHPFSAKDHDAISKSMLWLGTWHNGDRDFVHEDDEKRAAIIRYKSR